MTRETLSPGDDVAIPTIGVGRVAIVDNRHVTIEPLVDCEADQFLDSERGEYIVPYAVAVEWAHHY